MSTSLHDRLADLAGDAPSGAPGPDLWDRGVRRHRRRAVTVAAATAIGAVAVVAVFLGAVGTLRPSTDQQPAQVPVEELHLPRAAFPPSPWADGTDETGAPGPLAYVSIAERWRSQGLTGKQQGMQPFGVSAVDGSAVFLDLPGNGFGDLCCGGVVVSPDGTKVGYVRGGYQDGIAGFAVYDAVTGRTRMLEDPRNPVIVGLDYQTIAFSGDSRYLETAYSLSGSRGSRQVSLVVWDVATGESQVAEPAGNYWLPNHGSAPSGIVWSRLRDTFTYDPGTGATSSVRSPSDVVQAAYGPDGKALAMIAKGADEKADWRLLAGPTSDDLRELPLEIDADELLGWSDPQHVVVRQRSTGEAVEVDQRSGQVTSLELEVSGRQMMLPSYAADLWANPLVPGVRPPDVHDPRRPLWIGGGVTVALGLVLVVRRRRARA